MAKNLKSGDVVTIIAGDNKGKSGKIVKMDRKNHKAMIEGIVSVICAPPSSTQKAVRKTFTSASISQISRKKGNNYVRKIYSSS